MKIKFLIIYTDLYALICSDDEIKIGDWAIHNNEEYRNTYNEKPILCTKSNCDSIQEHWDKIIAHKPLNSEPKLQSVPLLPEMVVEDEVIRKLAQSYRDSQFKDISYGKEKVEAITASLHAEQGFYDGYKSATKTFSEDDLRNLVNSVIEFISHHEPEEFNEWFERKIQSMKRFKAPKLFVAEMEVCDNCINHQGQHLSPDCCHNYRLKTTKINGKEYLVGTYE
jgi:bacterioferritin (cytochrome b1)